MRVICGGKEKFLGEIRKKRWVPRRSSCLKSADVTFRIAIQQPPYRDGKRVLECLQKSLRIASSCIDEVTSVQLYVDALDQYIYYFEQMVEAVSMHSLLCDPSHFGYIRRDRMLTHRLDSWEIRSLLNTSILSSNSSRVTSISSTERIRIRLQLLLLV